MGQLGDELQGLEKVDVFPEIIRVGCVAEYSTLERFVTDFLQRNRRTRDILGEILLRLKVQNADAVVNTES